MLADFEIWPAWQFIAFAGALGLIGILAAGNRRLRRQKLQLTAALDHMPQGLCLYDGSERLRLCNKRYMEMYGFSPQVVKPGCSLRDVLRYRVSQGNLSGNADDYRGSLLAALKEGKTTSNVLNSGNGRTISVINRPMAGGGWVGTHEDITEREQLHKERDEMAARERRRAMVETAIASFRERMDKLLQTVDGSADAMKATATTLSTSSSETSQHAEGAVNASSEASQSVKTAWPPTN